MVRVAILLPSVGAVEELPQRACPAEVLHAQGQLICSQLSATCQLYWATHSAYLLAEANAFCSALTGELVRGDAILTAEHGSPAAARAWIRETSSRHKSYSGFSGTRRKKDASTLAGPTDAFAVRDCRQDATESSEASDLLTPPTKASAPHQPVQGENESARAQQRVQQPASAIPECEPRSQLLWRIVGQASSVTWSKSAECSSCLREAPLLSDRPPEPAPELACLVSEPQLPSYAHVWAELRPELIVTIAGKLPAAHVQTMVQTCSQWRCAILEDCTFLQRLSFNQPSSASAAFKRFSEGIPVPASTGLPVPLLVDKAAKAGNQSACLAIANLLTMMGMSESMRYWRRAARLGDMKAQVIYGTAAYSGSHGLTRDSEEAYRWLSKAIAKLGVLPSTVANRSLIARAALHLGFLALDGEATKLDLETAVSWFRLASKSGSRDAEIALGTLLRTGQYGPS